MTALSVPEFARISRDKLDDRVWRRLQHFDEVQCHKSGRPVFDWGANRFVRALNYVGVVQVPGATVEILPKIDSAYVDDLEAWRKSDAHHLAQRNLLYMLAFTRRVPLVERDLADLAIENLPLLDALVRLFACRLVDELKRGLDHGYIRREENLHAFKGRLLVPAHTRRNVGHRERFFVGYDEFLSDTWLNRILKACCRRLLLICSSTSVGRKLSEAIEHLSAVSDLRVEAVHFGLVTLNRNTERFRPLLDFARLVFSGRTPSPSQGAMATFSLLFSMHDLFEEFVARFARRHAGELSLTRSQIHAQASGHKKWLLSEDDKYRRFGLRPDILVATTSGTDSQYRCIVDTKWKRLGGSVEDRRKGVSQADLYQLYAYARQYDCPDNVLLFPAVPGVSPKSYNVFGAPQYKVRVEFLDVGVDMRSASGQQTLLASLKRVFVISDQPSQEAAKGPEQTSNAQ
jgi:5-methylcytosine-specific restriction enzyme subunit McrC